MIAWREIAERRRLFAVAALLGAIPFAVPLVFGSHDSSDVRLYSGLCISGILTVLVAVWTGSSVIARDLAEKRLAFYFSRPVSALSIWAGKMLGSWALSAGCLILALGPVLLLDREKLQAEDWFQPAAIPIVFFALLILTTASHVVGVAIRSRSGLIAVDVVLIGAFIAGGRSFGYWLRAEGVEGLSRQLPGFMIAACCAAIIASGAAQVSSGRVAIRRGFRAMSLALGSTLGIAALLAIGWSTWILAATPNDLDHLGIIAVSPRGPWIAIRGWVRSGRAQRSFLLDTSSGRWLHARLATDFHFSADGRKAIWVRPVWLSKGKYPEWRGQLVEAEMDSGRHPRLTGIPINNYLATALDPAGEHVAILTSAQVTVYALESGGIVSKGTVPRQARERREHLLSFPDAHLVRVVSGPGSDRLILWELDLGDSSVRMTGTIENDVTRIFPSSTGDLLVKHRTDAWTDGCRSTLSSLTLHDGRTGNALATIFSDSPSELGERIASGGVTTLDDGRIAVLVEVGKGRRIVVFERDGAPSASIDLNVPVEGPWGREVSRGLILIGSGYRPYLVDLDRHTVAPLPPGFHPVGFHWRGRAVDPDQRPRAGTPGTRLMLQSNDSRLVSYDPSTHSHRVILDLGRNISSGPP